MPDKERLTRSPDNGHSKTFYLIGRLLLLTIYFFFEILVVKVVRERKVQS